MDPLALKLAESQAIRPTNTRRSMRGVEFHEVYDRDSDLVKSDRMRRNRKSQLARKVTMRNFRSTNCETIVRRNAEQRGLVHQKR
jgi:hypothetical protein